MGMSRSIMIANAATIVLLALIGLIVSCVNFTFQSQSYVMTSIFSLLLIMGFTLLCVNCVAAKYDNVINVLYNNTVASDLDISKKEKTGIFAKLKNLLFRERSSQELETSSYPDQHDDSDHNSVIQVDGQRVLYNSGSEIDDSVEIDQNVSENSGSAECLDNTDFTIEDAEKMIQSRYFKGR
ncbi:hypothetical protein C1I72_03120 [Ehrlichia canis]|nr:hypothetical protein C1I72_03120 [Ehrlichia canis]